MAERKAKNPAEPHAPAAPPAPQPEGSHSEDKDLVILYVEDNEEFYTYWFDYIRTTWSDKSRHVRSLGQAKHLFASDFQPHLMIHDCNILFEEQQAKPSHDAGAFLYELARERNICVVVLTGSADRLDDHPYCADPPLAVASKPPTREQLHFLIDCYKEEKKKGAAQ